MTGTANKNIIAVPGGEDLVIAVRAEKAGVRHRELDPHQQGEDPREQEKTKAVTM